MKLLKDLLFEGITEIYTYVAPSKIPGAGKGLFAAKDIPANTDILYARVISIPENDWNLLVRFAPELIKRYGYSWGGSHMAVPGKYWPGFRLSPEAKEAIAKTVLRDGFHEFNFINDNQKNPNVAEFFYSRLILLISLRDIKKGEELTKPYPGHGTATYDPNVSGGKFKDFDWLKEYEGLYTA